MDFAKKGIIKNKYCILVSVSSVEKVRILIFFPLFYTDQTLVIDKRILCVVQKRRLTYPLGSGIDICLVGALQSTIGARFILEI